MYTVSIFQKLWNLKDHISDALDSMTPLYLDHEPIAKLEIKKPEPFMLHVKLVNEEPYTGHYKKLIENKAPYSAILCMTNVALYNRWN